MLLDLEIIRNSKGERSLDDVMKYTYNEYYKTQKRGFTDAEFKLALEKFTGKNLDDFYNKYIYGVADIDYNNLSYAGYKVTNTLANTNNAFLGIKLTPAGGKNIITAVTRNSPAWAAGLSVNDEVVSIDGLTVADADKFVATKAPGDKIEVGLNRDGIKIQLTVELTKSTQVKYSIDDTGNATEEQLTIRKKWLKM
jgi:predicted metalloprotease with PDZ domain